MTWRIWQIFRRESCWFCLSRFMTWKASNILDKLVLLLCLHRARFKFSACFTNFEWTFWNYFWDVCVDTNCPTSKDPNMLLAWALWPKPLKSVVASRPAAERITSPPGWRLMNFVTSYTCTGTMKKVKHLSGKMYNREFYSLEPFRFEPSRFIESSHVCS